ncbi:MAG: helix-turn-helix transcriptional regulator [Prevotella sp.]|jgi:transcriptional regulator with XRE-family HTH domain|nr:helix-turn-helix transcriptional regulator [Prevotella sp.]
METPYEIKRQHHGYSVKRLRDILGVKQEVLAERLNVTQQAVSKIEQKETLDDKTIDDIAKALNISPETIKNYSDTAAINIIVNALHDNSSVIQNYYPTINSGDKMAELYERMLQAEREKVSLLEEVLKGKK